MAVTTLYLVRHGEAASDDRADPGLTDLGKDQARAVGARLADFGLTAVVHSPTRRAQETAQIICRHLRDLAPTSSHDADDRTPVPSDRSSVPGRYQSFLDRVPATERDPDGLDLDAAVDRLATIGGRDRSLLVVTHAFVIAWFVRRALDAPTWRWLGLNHLNGALTTIEYSPDGARLVSYNDSGHLTPRMPATNTVRR